MGYLTASRFVAARVLTLTLVAALSAVPALPQDGAKPTLVAEPRARLSIKSKVEPEYPATARQFRVFGSVVAQITIGLDGKVESVDDVKGNLLLQDSVKTALRKWVFSPFVLDGKNVRVQTSMTFSFRL